MNNGFRQRASGGKKEAIRNMQTELKNMQMAMRINQMMTQQIIQQFQNAGTDIDNIMRVSNDLQYRTLAMMELLDVDTSKLEEVAERLKLKDYNAASDKEDAAKGYTVADTVGENSIVIITSEAPGNAGIFRSKFKLSESGVPAMQQGLLGKKVGDKVKITLNNLEHEVEVLAIREEPAAAAAPVDEVKVNATAETPAAV
jgi:transcription elongation GreA/GreB family factor